MQTRNWLQLSLLIVCLLRFGQSSENQPINNHQTHQVKSEISQKSKYSDVHDPDSISEDLVIGGHQYREIHNISTDVESLNIPTYKKKEHSSYVYIMLFAVIGCVVLVGLFVLMYDKLEFYFTRKSQENLQTIELTDERLLIAGRANEFDAEDYSEEYARARGSVDKAQSKKHKKIPTLKYEL